MPKIECIEIKISNSDGHFDMYFFLQILKLEENSRTKLFCSAILIQLQNLEKKVYSRG